MIRNLSLGVLLSLGLTLPSLPQAYPLDGFGETGIRRLEASRLAHEGAIKGPRQPAGALLGTDRVDLRLLAYKGMELPPVDPELSSRVKELLGSNADRELAGIKHGDRADSGLPGHHAFPHLLDVRTERGHAAQTCDYYTSPHSGDSTSSWLGVRSPPSGGGSRGRHLPAMPYHCIVAEDDYNRQNWGRLGNPEGV